MTPMYIGYWKEEFFYLFTNVNMPVLVCLDHHNKIP